MNNNGVYSITEELNSRHENSNSLEEWKESFEWASFWLNNLINTTRDLENLFINEVGAERYEQVLQEWVNSKKMSFYDTFDIKAPISPQNNPKTPKIDYIGDNVIKFPF